MSRIVSADWYALGDYPRVPDLAGVRRYVT